MLKKLLEFMKAHPAIRHGKKGFTLSRLIGDFGGGFLACSEPTASEIAQYHYDKKQWKEKNEKPAERLLHGLKYLGYVKVTGYSFRFTPTAYRFLKSRLKKVATSS